MRPFIPSLFIALLGAITGGSVMYLIDSRQLAQAQAATAAVREQRARLKAVSDAALTAEREVSAISRAAAQKIEALDAQLTEERQTHEADNRNYRAALAAGTERLRVAVSNCSAGGMSSTTSAASLGDGTAAYADLDAAVAERVFRAAADD